MIESTVLEQCAYGLLREVLVEFQKQANMRRVVYALLPIVVFSVMQYGWRPLAVLVVSLFFGALTEHVFVVRKKKKVTEAVLVTSLIYGLSLPPYVPLYLVPIGIVCAVILGKMIFGGFGFNIVNPALVGRLLMYVTFPLGMTSGWVQPKLFGIDAVASPTLLIGARIGEISSQPWWYSWVGWTPGSIGEGSVLLIAAGSLYLIFTKTANWRLSLSTVLGFTALVLPVALLQLTTQMQPLSFWAQISSGGLLFMAAFMVTDPVSAPKRKPAMWIYGAIAGLVTALVRLYSPAFPEGVSFGLLVANLLAPMLDEWFPKEKAGGSTKKPAGKAAVAGEKS